MSYESEPKRKFDNGESAMENKCKCSPTTDGCDVCAPKNDPYHPGYVEQRKGPYSALPDDDTGGWWVSGPGHLYHALPKYIQPSRDLAEKICALRNESYAEGYKAGRASRYGLREALKGAHELIGKVAGSINTIAAKYNEDDDIYAIEKIRLQIAAGALDSLARVITKALAADEEAGK